MVSFCLCLRRWRGEEVRGGSAERERRRRRSEESPTTHKHAAAAARTHALRTCRAIASAVDVLPVPGGP